MFWRLPILVVRVSRGRSEAPDRRAPSVYTGVRGESGFMTGETLSASGGRVTLP